MLNVSFKANPHNTLICKFWSYPNLFHLAVSFNMFIKKSCSSQDLLSSLFLSFNLWWCAKIWVWRSSTAVKKNAKTSLFLSVLFSRKTTCFFEILDRRSTAKTYFWYASQLWKLEVLEIGENTAIYNLFGVRFLLQNQATNPYFFSKETISPSFFSVASTWLQSLNKVLARDRSLMKLDTWISVCLLLQTAARCFSKLHEKLL